MLTTELIDRSVPREEEPVSELTRSEARRRVQDLIRAAQTDGGLCRADAVAIIALGERRGWADVVKLGMFLGVVHERSVAGRPGTEWVEQLLERAQSDDDPVGQALALALRSLPNAAADGRAPVDADRDLARAMVLLDDHEGLSMEATSAHIECALSAERRDLWELQLHHYEAAERCLDPADGGEEKRPVLLYNRAEVQVNWVLALRERGDAVADMRERAEQARRALDAADIPEMPANWRVDLVAFRTLLDAIAPPDGVPRFPIQAADGEFAGHVHLARAFATGHGPEARGHVNLALAAINPESCQRTYLLALAFAAEVEAAMIGPDATGLRWGRELVARRWAGRLASLASMESLMEVERMAAEHALLQQHAYLDDLTGLANRRGLARFIDGLAARGVGTVALALVDLDRFKLVNDGYGHAVGDATLARFAALLRGGVRDQDLVVRLGGDEFLLLLTMQDHDAARRRCDTILEMITAATWEDLGAGLTVTGSLGVAFGPLADFETLCGRADAALYRAKQSGGAQVAL